MTSHSSVLAWRIPGPAEPGGLPSLGSHRVGHACSDLAAAAAEGVKFRVVGRITLKQGSTSRHAGLHITIRLKSF